MTEQTELDKALEELDLEAVEAYTRDAEGNIVKIRVV